MFVIVCCSLLTLLFKVPAHSRHEVEDYFTPSNKWWLTCITLTTSALSNIGFIISLTGWKTKITEQFVSQFSTPAARLPCLLKADLNTFMRSLLLSFQWFLFKVFVIITVKKLSSLSWWSFTHCGEIISLITSKQWLFFRCVKLDQPLDAFLVCSRITRDRKLKVRLV